MVEGGLRLMTRIWRARAGKAKSSSGWMISATSSPCQPFPLLDCTMCSSGTSNTVSRLLSSKGVCSTPCLPSCCQTDAADTGVMSSSEKLQCFLKILSQNFQFSEELSERYQSPVVSSHTQRCSPDALCRVFGA